MRSFTLSFSTAAALLASAGLVCADVITPAGVTYTGTASEQLSLGLDDENSIIDGSGLSAPLALDESNLGTVTHAAVNLIDNAWATVDFGPAGGDWFTPGENDGSVIFGFDLGAAYVVDSIAVWGYHFGAANGNSISSARLDFSTDGTGAIVDSSQTIAIPQPGAIDLATIVGLSATSANYITLEVLDNHFGAPATAGGDRVGIAEVVFTSVPEPASVVLLGVGLVGCLVARRRRA